MIVNEGPGSSKTTSDLNYVGTPPDKPRQKKSCLTPAKSKLFTHPPITDAVTVPFICMYLPDE